MKTTTLTIRLTHDDKQLISDLAWKLRLSVADLLVMLARQAADEPAPDLNFTAAGAKSPVDDIRSQLYEMKGEIDTLRREVIALAPRRAAADPAE